MKGQVDSSGRALMTVRIRPNDRTDGQDVPAWIDTAFNGDLVLSQQHIDELDLAASGTVSAVLADGSEVTLPKYVCRIDWFGEERELEIVANQGKYALLGVGLLLNRDLHISYRSNEITLE